LVSIVASAALGLATLVMNAAAGPAAGAAAGGFGLRRRRAPAQPFKQRLGRLDRRPHTFEPMTAFAEVDAPSQLFESHLLDTTGFQPNDRLFLSAARAARRSPPRTASERKGAGEGHWCRGQKSRAEWAREGAASDAAPNQRTLPTGGSHRSPFGEGIQDGILEHSP